MKTSILELLDEKPLRLLQQSPVASAVRLRHTNGEGHASHRNVRALLISFLLLLATYVAVSHFLH